MNRYPETASGCKIFSDDQEAFQDRTQTAHRRVAQP
jgi:hypothetical protein